MPFASSRSCVLYILGLRLENGKERESFGSVKAKEPRNSKLMVLKPMYTLFWTSGAVFEANGQNSLLPPRTEHDLFLEVKIDLK